MSGPTCECCAGIRRSTPAPIRNRPGLPELRYRAGTYGQFLDSMLARLSDGSHPQTAALTTREPDDPSIALLDGWAVIADILTFYQERIANEGYLRTAVEGSPWPGWARSSATAPAPHSRRAPSSRTPSTRVPARPSRRAPRSRAARRPAGSHRPSRPRRTSPPVPSGTGCRSG